MFITFLCRWLFFLIKAVAGGIVTYYISFKVNSLTNMCYFQHSRVCFCGEVVIFSRRVYARQGGATQCGVGRSCAGRGGRGAQKEDSIFRTTKFRLGEGSKGKMQTWFFLPDFDKPSPQTSKRIVYPDKRLHDISYLLEIFSITQIFVFVKLSRNIKHKCKAMTLILSNKIMFVLKLRL